MVPLSRDVMWDQFDVWNKSCLTIQQNIINFLAVDYTIIGNQRMLKQQQ